jgi:hypothetical protein
VAEVIIDLLEIVDVGQDQRQRGAALARVGQLALRRSSKRRRLLSEVSGSRMLSTWASANCKRKLSICDLDCSRLFFRAPASC